MALSDLLYPGNPKRRENVIRKSQELIILTRSNFDTTNDLTEIVNKHLHSSFRPITLDERATIKQNCDVMIERVNQIQAQVKEVDEELKKKLDPILYESLQHVSLQDFNKIINMSAAAKFAVSLVCQITTAVLVGFLMKNVQILINITSMCCKVAVGLVGSIVIGLGVDLIVSAILGHIERGQLETALKEYEEALEKIRPASKKYQKAINEVEVLLKYMKKE